jgi:RNA polymerase sigma-70 factor (ECF subfamily)
MGEQAGIAELIGRIRSGDGEAAAELVARYEPAIRREVRLRLEDPRLRRVFDSMDVCQSVLASFFVRAAAGQFDIQEPGQLVRLLVTMTRNKVASAAKRQYRQRRDNRRVEPGGDEALGKVADAGPSPSQFIAGKELLNAFRQGLNPAERQLADLRAEGLTWEEVAARVGGTSQARRVQLARAIDRVAQQLGLDGEGVGDDG